MQIRYGLEVQTSNRIFDLSTVEDQSQEPWRNTTISTRRCLSLDLREKRIDDRRLGDTPDYFDNLVPPLCATISLELELPCFCKRWPYRHLVSCALRWTSDRSCTQNQLSIQWSFSEFWNLHRKRLCLWDARLVGQWSTARSSALPLETSPVGTPLFYCHPCGGKPPLLLYHRCIPLCLTFFCLVLFC